MVARKTKLIYTADNHPVLLPALAVPAQCEPACKEADLRKQFSKVLREEGLRDRFWALTGIRAEACAITYKRLRKSPF